MTGHGHGYLLASTGFYSWTIAICPIFINDIVIDIGFCICLFADGTSLFIIVEDRVSSAD